MVNLDSRSLLLTVHYLPQIKSNNNLRPDVVNTTHPVRCMHSSLKIDRLDYCFQELVPAVGGFYTFWNVLRQFLAKMQKRGLPAAEAATSDTEVCHTRSAFSCYHFCPHRDLRLHLQEQVAVADAVPGLRL